MSIIIDDRVGEPACTNPTLPERKAYLARIEEFAMSTDCKNFPRTCRSLWLRGDSLLKRDDAVGIGAMIALPMAAPHSGDGMRHL
jgi:hypothetical protein